MASPMASPMAQFPIMELPLELREEIWFYTMSDPDPTDNNICTYPESNFDRKVANMVHSRRKYVWYFPNYNILGVSKAVRDEAIGVLHRRSRLDLDRLCKTGTHADMAVKALGPRACQELRSVKVVLDLVLVSGSILCLPLWETDAEHVRVILSGIKTLVNQLKGLRCVGLELHLADGWEGHPRIVRYLRAIIAAAIQTLKGKEVTFASGSQAARI